MSSDEELSPSELGTKDYWSSLYKRDIDNFKDHGDAGEIWFGEDIVDRLLRWFDKNVPKEYSIGDLGCGNGMFIVEAALRGYINLTGFDYCQEAVDLSKAVIKSNSLDSIELFVIDLTSNLSLNSNFDVLVDKGTYDAISLNPNNVKESRNTYVSNVSKLLKPDGCFVITSCNWTEEELVKQFSSFFSKTSTIPTPTFKFGGKEGTLVSCLVFKKET